MRGSGDDVVVIGADGGVHGGAITQGSLAGLAGSYRVLTTHEGVLILKRTDGVSARLLMAGEIACASSVLEAVSVISQSNWSGVLGIYGPNTARRLTIA